MANVNAPFGLKPIGALGVGDPRVNSYGKTYTIATALNATLDLYTPVVLTGTGNDITTGAGTGEFLVGSFLGCEYLDPSGKLVKKHNWVAQTATKTGSVIKAYVADDPDLLFEILGDNSSWVVADVGLNVDYSLGTRNAVVNQSGAVAVRTGINTTATLMLRILGLSDTVTANTWAAYARLKVKINAHRYATATGA